MEKEYTAFDEDIKVHINSVFSDLNQMGVGPESGFAIESEEDTWEVYIGEKIILNNVRSYMHLRLRLLFDPPPHAFLVSAVEDQVKELSWRIIEQAESLKDREVN